MKNVIVAGVAALALVGCGAKEEAVVVEETPAVEATAPVEAEVVEAPAEAAPTNDAAPEGVDGGKTAVP
jgi:hypothetical protein